MRRKRGDREFLILGLTEANIELLRGGNPIRVTAETHRGAVPEGWVVGIFLGQNREELRLQMEKAGIISPEDEPNA